MPPLVIHAFVPLSTHSSCGLVVHGAGAQRRDVGTGVGLADAERAELHLARVAVALRHPLHHLLGRSVATDSGSGQRRSHDGHADAGVAPEHLLDRDRQRESGGIAEGVEQELPAVQADLGGLLDDRVRELLALVPLVAGRTNDVFGEVVHPLLDLELVFVECEISHDRSWSAMLPAGNYTAG